MKLKKVYALVVLLPLVFSFTLHKYYLSLTQIEYSKEQASLQIVMNVFMDDIELAVNKENGIDLQLTTQKELPNNDGYFKKYLKDRIQISVNGTQKQFNYLGKEYEGDLVYFYLEIEDINSVKDIHIKNTVLMDYFPDQQNMIKLKVGKKYKSLLLTQKNDKGLLKF